MDCLRSLRRVIHGDGGDLAEESVCGSFLFHRLAEMPRGLMLAETLGPCRQRTVAGNLVMLSGLRRCQDARVPDAA